MLDIGLGETAGETLDAVKAGFVVIAFEPMPSHIHLIRRRVLSLGMQGSVRFVDPVPRDGGTNMAGITTDRGAHSRGVCLHRQCSPRCNTRDGGLAEHLFVWRKLQYA